MTKWRLLVLTPGVIAAAFVIAIACRDATAPPTELQVGGKKAAWFNPTFRLTGGGRVDTHNDPGGAPHTPGDNDKSTPETRDFATFGFQARPLEPGTPAGSGHITWVEHDPGAIGGGFTYHGDVNEFTEPIDGSDVTMCGRFAGTGTAHLRNGDVVSATFEVQHACDVQEPGRGYDHISISIDLPYARHGLLSGGNIQTHKL